MRAAGALGGLWCAWLAGAVYVRAYQTNQPAAPPPAELQAATIPVRTVAILPDLAFGDRWQAPAAIAAGQPRPASQIIQQASLAAEDPIDEPAAKAQPRPRRAERRAEADSVCGSRGRHYFHRRHWTGWRCNR